MRTHLGRAASAAVVVGVLGVIGSGCLTRPVATNQPTLKTNFTAVVRQAAIDKVDILFAIDNSASMGDKQLLLAQAVPDLVNRLVTPNCVDDNGIPNGQTTTDGKCAQGKAEFQPVHDMHLGIVTSSLGSRGADECDDNAPSPFGPGTTLHNNDDGKLINRGSTVTGTTIDIAEHTAPDTGPSNYLSWLPDVDANKGKDPNVVSAGAPPVKVLTKLIADFQEGVAGVHEYGCGLEAQLESFYRFLIQPDPYAQVIPDPKDSKGQRRTLDGVNGAILKQRHDFLRPDSLVAVIMLTDEDDSAHDPRAVGGQGWAYSAKRFPGSVGGGAARGTSGCDNVQTVNTQTCTSCGFSGHSGDPNCQKPGDIDSSTNQAQPGYYTLAEDPLNVRYFHMRQRYGVDPQFPVNRYVNGLHSYSVPSREVPVDPKDPSKGTTGELYNGAGTDNVPNNTYKAINNCTNPLFAQNLPTDPGVELCKLTRGPRTNDLVFFALIGGVPWQLLTDQGAKGQPFKDKLTRDDWVKIVGNDPENYDYTGQDIHMVQSITPRAGLPDPKAADTADAMNGREWDTKGSDLQYACVFDLPAQKNCTDPKFQGACDCTAAGPNPPLCNGQTQTRGKAYPTIRELTVARNLGDQGIVASLCPRSLDVNSPDYGYRPAVKAIVDRLKNALANQCLPQHLTPGACGDVPCLILETLSTPGVACTSIPGLTDPDPQVLAKFREQQKADQGDIHGDAGPGFVDETKLPVCQVTQLIKPGNYPGTCGGNKALQPITDFPEASGCGGSAEAGWCYVEGKAAGTCAQAILFSPTGNPQVGAKISLQCIEASSAGSTGTGGGDAGP
jgi:hypothetical protein